MKWYFLHRCKQRFFVAFLGFSLFTAIGAAQHYELKYFSTQDRLTDQTNGTIFQDNYGFLWISSYLGLNRFDGREIMSIHSGSSADIRASDLDIEKLYRLSNGEIAYWKPGPEIGVFNPATYQFRTVSLANLLSGYPIVVSLNEYGDGKLYGCMESDAGIVVFRYDGTTITLIYKDTHARPGAIDRRTEQPKLIVAPITDERFLLFDADRGYFVLNVALKSLTPLQFPASFENKEKWLYFIIKDNEGRWLLSCSEIGGVYILDSNFRLSRHPDFDQTASFRRCEIDELGNMVLAVTVAGENICHLYNAESRTFTKLPEIPFTDTASSTVWSKNFEEYIFCSTVNGLLYGRDPVYRLSPFLCTAPQNETGISMRHMTQLATGDLLLGTEWDGLYVYDTKKRATRPLASPTHWPADLQPLSYTRTLLKDGQGSVWISAYAKKPNNQRPSGYLVRLDEGRMQLDTFYHLPYRIQSMVMVNDSMILAGIEAGLFTIQLGPELKITFLTQPAEKWPNNLTINQIVPTGSRGNFYILTNNGLFHYNYSEDIIDRLSVSGSLVNNFLHLYQENDSTLWLGTKGDGLYKYNLATDELEAFRYREGIRSDIVCGILPQGPDHLLLSTYHGLYQFDMRTGLASSQGLKDGLMHFEFNQGSYLALSDSSWLFGGMNGALHLEKVRELQRFDQTQFLISYQKARLGSEQDTTLFSPQDFMQGITLPANDRRLQLGVSWLNLQDIDNTLAYYRLYPLSDQWQVFPETRELNFSWIPPGHYELQMSLRPDGPPDFSIHVKAEWKFHERRIVQLIGVLMVAGILALLYYLYFDRKLIRVKSTQLEENERFRQRLFAFISHEFKTPLTIIFGLTHRLKQRFKQEDVVKDLDQIERHGRAMTSLVTQMIELNQLQANDWHLNYDFLNLHEELKLIIAQLHPLAESLEVQLELHLDPKTVWQSADLEKLQVIINNLLTNAIKFSPRQGKVTVTLAGNQQEWSLTVQDEGPGIQEHEIGQVFELFYQSTQQHDRELPNSGIGLAYVKAIVEVLKGRIEVSNEAGSVFKVFFPAYPLPEKELLETEDQPFIATDKITPTLVEISQDDRPLLLLVEDTIDVANYIVSCFPEEKYQVIWARDGEDGERQAIEQVPDIVVTDVRMPGKSGFELCKTLKNHPATNHIPIVMLTALSDQESKLEGLQARADIYLYKPFQEEELLLTVANLLYTRDQARAYFSAQLQPATQQPALPEVAPFEHEYLQEINTVLEANYTDPLFGVAEMSNKLFLSRTQLHRKIKALLDQTPSDLLRNFRLEKARFLLDTSALSVSEIALMCGFKDPSYFTKVFTNAFGSSPSSYRKEASN